MVSMLSKGLELMTLRPGAPCRATEPAPEQQSLKKKYLKMVHLTLKNKVLVIVTLHR